MPIYEYICKKCGKFDHLHKTMKEGALDKCPKCKGKVTKLMSTGVGVKFVGYGFPGNDMRHPPPPPSSTNRKTQRKKEAKLRKDGWQNSFTPKH